MEGRVTACLGPAGSYSEAAAKKLCPQDTLLYCRNFPEAVEEGRVRCSVLPVENAIRGGVLQVLDLLGSRDVFAVEELVLPIDHRLIRRKGVPLSAIERVYSHEQAIGQCAEYLRRTLPEAQILFTDSTAKCLQLLDAHTAGIVGAHVSGEGLELSAENIADEKNNFTRFLRLVRGGTLPGHSEKIFLSAVCEHRPGALYGLLRIFADDGVNLTRIESRPIPSVVGEYRFFIAIDGDIAQPQVREALSLAEARCRFFRILGVYDQTPKTGASSRQTSAARTP